MKAIAISDNHLKWEDADDPICKNNEVIITSPIAGPRAIAANKLTNFMYNLDSS